MNIDVEGLNDCVVFIKKLITVLSDEQLRAMLHTFYSDYSEIECGIKVECTKRGISTDCEFIDGDFKY